MIVERRGRSSSRIVRARVGDVQANVGREEARVARVRSGLQRQGSSGAGGEKSEKRSTEHGDWRKERGGEKRGEEEVIGEQEEISKSNNRLQNPWLPT